MMVNVKKEMEFIMSNIVIINGTNSEGSRVNGIVQYIQKQQPTTKVVDVYKLPANDLISANYNSEEILKANEIVDQADVVIVLTPVYKASYTGILKTYIDLIPQKGLTNKTIIPIAVGGSLHHLLVIDYALKPVLSSLNARTILQGVYVLDKQIERTDDGFTIEQDILDRIDTQLEQALK